MKTTRRIEIADHLWDAFGRMAQEMGSDREVLVNQAMHVFARLNGFVVPGAPERGLPNLAAPPLPKPAAAPPAIPGPAPIAPPAPAPNPAVGQVLEAAARLEEAIAEPTPVEAQRAIGLVVVREDGTTLEVAKDRFLIGRGRHCDLVIDSAKISREHAAILRDGTGWAIEDLGSSNGTWHKRERIDRRRIADGDEFFVCSEKVKCVLR
ncbi:MAG TPA: FHA domain-containing protein [Anaeromyxobacter sp.]|nr:FHA domain-containing protein [Anaeromyxobacter sp.]